MADFNEDIEELAAAEADTVLLPGESSSPSESETKVRQTWCGFGQTTSESEADHWTADKENMSLAANHQDLPANQQDLPANHQDRNAKKNGGSPTAAEKMDVEESQDSPQLSLRLEETQAVEIAGQHSPTDIFHQDSQTNDDVTIVGESQDEMGGDKEETPGSQSPLSSNFRGGRARQKIPFPSFTSSESQKTSEERVKEEEEDLEDLEQSVVEIPFSPAVNEVSVINISDDSKNDSLKLELSDTQTPQRWPITQPSSCPPPPPSPLSCSASSSCSAPRTTNLPPTTQSQLSEILAPNALLYDDIDAVIDNDEDVQDMSNMMAGMEPAQQQDEDDKDALDMSVFELSDMSPVKELRKEIFPSPLKYGRKGELDPNSEHSYYSGKNVPSPYKESAKKRKVTELSSEEESRKKSSKEARVGEGETWRTGGGAVARERMDPGDKSSTASGSAPGSGELPPSAAPGSSAASPTQHHHSQVTQSCADDELTCSVSSRPVSRVSNGQPESSDSRSDSQNNFHSPDISCSPIVGDHFSEADSKAKELKRARLTSTPGQKAVPVSGLSSPQKHLRKKLKPSEQQQLLSSEEELGNTAIRPEKPKPKKKVERGEKWEKREEEEQQQQETSKLEYSDTNQHKLTPTFKEPRPKSAEGEYFILPKHLDEEELDQIQILIRSFGYEDYRLVRVGSLGSLGSCGSERLPKRLSDVSSLSRSTTGGSSGYLGGSSGTSSSNSSNKSRLSLNPETRIEPHTVIAPLPGHTRSKLSPSQESLDPQVGSPTTADVGVGPPVQVTQVSDSSKVAHGMILTQQEVLDPILEEPGEAAFAKPSGAATTPVRPKAKAPRPRSTRKGSTDSPGGGVGGSGTVAAKKRLTKKRKPKRTSEDEDDEVDDDETFDPAYNGSSSSRRRRRETNSADRQAAGEGGSAADKPTTTGGAGGGGRLQPGSQVFARWTDPAGVYYYAAEVIDVVSSAAAQGDLVRVRFLEDSIERTVKSEGEVVCVTQLSPGDQVTVMHDELKAYEVTATLMSFPTRDPLGNVEYELNITPTDSEPQLNEDSRTVKYYEVSLSDHQASIIIRQLGLVPASNKVSADINFENLIFGKRKPRSVAGASPAPSTSSSSRLAGLYSPAERGSARKNSSRKKRGGSNVEDSATTMNESSAAETTPRKKRPVQARLFTSTTEDEDPEVLRRAEALSGRAAEADSSKARPLSVKARPEVGRARTESGKSEAETGKPRSGKSEAETGKPRSGRKHSSSSNTYDTNMFKGMCFVLTQSKYEMPMTDPEEEESGTEPEHLQDLELKFDKSAVRNAILAGGGRILQRFPSQHDLANTLDEELVTISDKTCRTMNYLLSLAHAVPIVSYMYILHCQSAGRRMDYRAGFLLPAGHSSLLMREVEQGRDQGTDLLLHGCLLPSPPATSTRQSQKTQFDEDLPRKKILSGLHVLIISKDKDFTDDWQSVLDSVGARVTKRINGSSRLSQIRTPDVVVTDSQAPQAMCQDLRKRPEIPVVSTNWAIQCVINNARVAFDNFTCNLPK